MTWLNLTWLDLAWLDLTWLDLTWLDLTWLDLTWLDLTYVLVSTTITLNNTCNHFHHLLNLTKYYYTILSSETLLTTIAVLLFCSPFIAPYNYLCSSMSLSSTSEESLLSFDNLRWTIKCWSYPFYCNLIIEDIVAWVNTKPLIDLTKTIQKMHFKCIFIFL